MKAQKLSEAPDDGVAVNPFVARKQLPNLLTGAGYPTTLGTLHQLASKGDGPPIQHRWGGTTYYDPAKVLAWAHKRARIEAKRALMLVDSN